MKIIDLESYKALIMGDYKNFCLSLTNKSKYTRKSVTKEFDSDLWLLSEILNIIMNYKYEDDHNAFTEEEMNQWGDIFNDITNKITYLNFKN